MLWGQTVNYLRSTKKYYLFQIFHISQKHNEKACLGLNVDIIPKSMVLVLFLTVQTINFEY